MRNCLKFFALIFVIVTCLGGLLGCFSKTNSIEFARERLKEYGVEVPIDSSIIYLGKDEGSFGPGRPAMYIVFEFKEEPLEWLAEYNFQVIEDKKESERATGSFVDNVKEQSELWGGVSQEYLPDFTHGYLYLTHGDAIYFVFTPHNLSLYVLVMRY